MNAFPQFQYWCGMTERKKNIKTCVFVCAKDCVCVHTCHCVYICEFMCERVSKKKKYIYICIKNVYNVPVCVCMFARGSEKECVCVSATQQWKL